MNPKLISLGTCLSLLTTSLAAVNAQAMHQSPLLDRKTQNSELDHEPTNMFPGAIRLPMPQFPDLDPDPQPVRKAPPVVKRPLPPVPPPSVRKADPNVGSSAGSNAGAPSSGAESEAVRPLSPGPSSSTDSSVSAKPSAPVELGDLPQLLKARLESGSTSVGQTALQLLILKKIYKLNGFKPYFVGVNGLTEVGKTVKAMLTTEAEFHGFSSAYYFTPDAASRIETHDPNQLVELDLLLTQGYVFFSMNMAAGRVNPKDPAQNIADIELPKQRGPSYVALNKSMQSSTSLQNDLLNLAPQTVPYSKLLLTLRSLNQAQRAGGWPDFSDATALKVGVSHPNVIGVRIRLADLGLIDANERQNTSAIYDANLASGVMRLQKLMFKQPDGIVGNDTYEILRVPLAARIVQVKANLERWRLLPHDLGQRFVFVDLGRQELDIMQDNKLLTRMRVIVGKDLHGTPTMIDTIRRVIIKPYWHAPTSIVVNEFLPALMKNPEALLSQGIRVLSRKGEVDPNDVDWSQYSVQHPPPYEFRQDPGPKNALGEIMFTLNNAHAIYMHYTDNPAAFNQEERFLSHGCIRLQHPLDLATYLLGDQGFDEDAVREQIGDENNVEKPIPVKDPIRVYIFGSTMVTYSSGMVKFGKDVYKQDQRIVDAMNGVHTDAPTVEATSKAQEKATVQLQPAAPLPNSKPLPVKGGSSIGGATPPSNGSPTTPRELDVRDH